MVIIIRSVFCDPVPGHLGSLRGLLMSVLGVTSVSSTPQMTNRAWWGHGWEWRHKEDARPLGVHVPVQMVPLTSSTMSNFSVINTNPRSIFPHPGLIKLGVAWTCVVSMHIDILIFALFHFALGRANYGYKVRSHSCRPLASVISKRCFHLNRTVLNHRVLNKLCYFMVKHLEAGLSWKPFPIICRDWDLRRRESRNYQREPEVEMAFRKISIQRCSVPREIGNSEYRGYDYAIVGLHFCPTH